MIVGLFPELDAAGGVQRAGRLTAAALASFAAQRAEPYRFLSLNDPLGPHFIRVGTQEISFEGFGRRKPRFLASSLRAALRWPRVVVALHPNLSPIVAGMRICSPRTRTVVFAHGIEVWTPLGRIRRRTLRQSDLVLAPSADTMRQLKVQQGVSEAKIKKLRWSLGPEFPSEFPPDTSVPASGPPPNGFPSGRIILTVGRWDAREAYKGADHLIAAMPRLLGSTPDLHLVAIGDGSDLPRLEQLAGQSGAGANIHFLPRLSPEQLWSAYDHCDIFALPSRGEGFGLVFLEAMAHGKPVVGGDHGGTPEIIEDGVSGFLVQYGDVEQLTDRLRRLLTDEPFRRQMGAEALQRVYRDFTFDRFSRELIASIEPAAIGN